MSHPIPADARLLTARLRMLADEIESAARYGIPIPTSVSLNSYANIPGASFSATPEEFDAWADYCQESTTEEYDHDSKHWYRAEADVNGLWLSFATHCAPILVADVAS